MKRKLALLLAAVMVIAALPMNVFASSTNTITKSVNAENETAFFENGYLSNTTGDVENVSGVKYWVDGTDLKITLNDNTPAGRSFTLTLENARWFFRRNGVEDVFTPGTSGWTTEIYTGGNTTLDAAISSAVNAASASTSFSIDAVKTGGDGIDGTTADNLMDSVAAQDYLAGANGASWSLVTVTEPTVAAIVSDLQANRYAAFDAYITLKYVAVQGRSFATLFALGSPDSFPAGGGKGIGTLTQWTTDGTTKQNGYLANKDNIAIVDTSSISATLTEDLAEGLIINVLTALANGEAYYTYNGRRLSLQKSSVDDTSSPAVYTLVTVNSSGGNAQNYNHVYSYSEFDMPITLKVYQETSDSTTSGTNSGRNDRFGGTNGINARYIGTGRSELDPITSTTNATNYNPAKGTLNWESGRSAYTYTRNNGLATEDKEVGYNLEVVESGNNRVATITTTQSAQKGAFLLIPLVIRTTAEGDYRVKITSNITEVSSGNLLIGSKISGKTNTTAAADYTHRNSFDGIKMTINELKVGSIKSGSFTFEIRAPRGYYFDNNLYSNKAITIVTEGGLKWADSTTGRKYFYATDGSPVTSNVHMNFKYQGVANRETDYSIIEVTVDESTFTPSTSLTGSLYFYGFNLILEDEESLTTGDVYMSIKDTNGSSNRVITDQDVKVGSARDYDITLKKLEDKVPELISGRLEGHVKTYNGYYSDAASTIDDEYHQAASVYFEENVSDAWWAQRNTVFTLPEEVRFMKVVFDEIDNMEANGADAKLMLGTNSDSSGEYYNARKRINNVTIDNNKMTLTNLSIDSGEKAYFEMDIWLSIRVDFEGEINLVLNNSALKYTAYDEDISCTIATAIRPIEVETKVTEAKVGYQYVSVADFDIKENKAGALLRGETVYISVTDEISFDMAIAKGFKYDRTEGNIVIKDIETRSILGNYSNTLSSSGGAQLSFVVDKESTVASTMSFTNVQVKVDRSVAYSNLSNDDDRGINLYAWGPAVAKNYYYLYTDSQLTNSGNEFYRLNTNDLFNVAGISAKYINVVTLPSDSTQSGFTNQVAVTMGSTSYTINGQTYELEVAPYVSTASNSAMVPVRFIANALGLDVNAVKWDPATSTVTIDAGTRIIQFQTGSSYYSVNGTMTPMASPDGLAVEMEITGERAFVPFRALGEAFNITVDWDAPTSTATYNAPTVQ